MKRLHNDFSEVNRKWGLSRGTSVSETGARHRSTEEYRRQLSEECTDMERRIDRDKETLFNLHSAIRLAERKVKGLSTMVDNLTRSKAEKEARLEALHRQILSDSENPEALREQVEALEKELASVQEKLADKQEKLGKADQDLETLREQMLATEKRTEQLKEQAYRYSKDVHSKVDGLLKDVLAGRMAEEFRQRLAGMDAEQRQAFDGTLLQSVSEKGTEILHCATLLFVGLIDDATTFAETHGGGGGGSDLKWGRDDEEDNRAWAYRCMMRAVRMMKPSNGRKPKR